MIRWYHWLLLLGIVLLFAIPLRTPLNIYDEGLALVGGMRVAHGEIPFRDYWAIYPPGQSYTLAAIFRLAGVSVLAERLYDSLVRLLLCGAIYAIALRLLGSSRGAWVPLVSIATLLAAALFYGYAVFPALLFAFASLALFYNALDRTSRPLLWTTGLSIGITALFRIDTATYVSGGILVALLLAELNDKVSKQSWWLRVWQKGFAIALPVLLIVVPIYGLLAWVGNAGQMVNNLLVFPATTFHDVRHLPLPTWLPDWSRWEQRGTWLSQFDWTLGEWLRFYLPLLTYVLSAIVILISLLRSLLQRQMIVRSHAYASALLILGIGLFIQAMSRYDAIHALPTSLPTVLLICWLWRELTRVRWWRSAFSVLPGIVSLPALAAYGLIPILLLESYVEYFPLTRCYAEIEQASCAPISPDQAQIVAALNQHASSGDAVFVASATHDRIFVNDVSLYFLAGHPIPTRYHELHPGVVTTRLVQQEIINELQTKAVKWLFVVDWPNPNEPNDSALSSGITDLDDFIHENYQRIEQFGFYQLWEKKM
ncbi:MAG: glycosyltransferase family 39 protein [Caldilineaceae bacterium]